MDKKKLSPRSQAFHKVINKQNLLSELIKKDPVESEIIAEEIESVKIEQRRLLKEGIPSKQKKESKTETEPSKNVGQNFFSGMLELAKVDPEEAQKVLGSLGNKQIEYLKALNASSKNPVNLIPLLPFLKNEKTDTVADTVKIAMSLISPPQPRESEIEKAIAMIEIAKILTPPPKPPSPKKVMDYVKATFESWDKTRTKNMADFEAEITKIKLKRERDRVEILWKTYTNPNRPKKSDEDKLKFAEYLVTPIIGKIESIIAAIEIPVEEETLEAPVESEVMVPVEVPVETPVDVSVEEAETPTIMEKPKNMSQS